MLLLISMCDKIYIVERMICVNKKITKKAMSVFFAMLIAAGLLCGCGADEIRENISLSDGARSTELGEGEREFCIEVVDADKAIASYVVHTDDATVGGALLNLGFIDGEQGPYGLYVKTVNGKTLDYDKDKMYWAFYIDGEYATKGVDETEIDRGSVYSFRAEK